MAASATYEPESRLTRRNLLEKTGLAGSVLLAPTLLNAQGAAPG